jgi:hypothetical protein
MAIQFPPTDTLPAPTTGTTFLDDNGVTWRATVQTVGGSDVTLWTPDSQMSTGAFNYLGFATLTQPIPNSNILLGTIYSSRTTVDPANINVEWGGIAASSGGTQTISQNDLIICTTDNQSATPPRFFWAPINQPTSPFLRDGSTIRPVHPGDSLEVKYDNVAGGNILFDNYTELP